MDQELIDFLNTTVDTANDLIDKLIVKRKIEDNKATTRYMIKKLEVIVGACHRAQDKLPVEFKL